MDESKYNITLFQDDPVVQYCLGFANITLANVFTINISSPIYNFISESTNTKNKYKVKYYYYYYNVINRPNFINFTNNDNVITTINNNGSIQFGNYTENSSIDINEYSIISPNNKILTSNIKTDIITSYNTCNISFDNKNITNLNSLSFSGIGDNSLNVGNILVKDIISTNSNYNININNSLFNNNINDSNLISTSNLFNNQYYNSIISVYSPFDINVKPAISISGIETSFVQKNSNYIYQTILKDKIFRKNDVSSYTDTKTCYEINYSNLINKNFEYNDTNFNNFNSTHILQHIIDDDIISFGQNYNLCFYNGFFTSNTSNYSRLLSQSTYNSSFAMSLGVPYKNTNISDYEFGNYYYNYIDYFNSNIRNNNYMLNIFGNTKISGIDGNTNALNVIIHDESNINGIFPTNIGIGKEPRIINNKNILDVNGDIYTSNIYINDTNISDYLEINVPTIIRKTNINTSNINEGIIDLQHIPIIPSWKLEPPGTRPIINESETIYIHPQIGSDSIDNIDNADYHTDGTTEYYYNIFESSSNIIINDSIIADILLIGGGGSVDNDKGGAGGDVILLNNIDIVNNSIITFIIGKGGIFNSDSIYGTFTSINISNIDKQTNITYKAYGGSAGINQGIGSDINPNLANEIYNIFSTYSDYGFVNLEKLYFAGTGNENGQTPSLSKGKIGSGGYFSYIDSDKNGIDGAIFIRYKFVPEYINIYDTVNDTLGLLQYNWSNNNWSLNYDNFNNCNILLNKITETSNNIVHEIHKNSNLLIQESENTCNYIQSINDVFILNSNYIQKNISNLYQINSNIFDIDNDYIIKNEKIPLLNINKLDDVGDFYLYNPKVNNEIVNNTSYFKIKNSLNYIILEFNNDNEHKSHKNYDIFFQNDEEVDILLVGAGGKGSQGNGTDFHTGGGGGAIIEIKNLYVSTGDRFTINVGKGGGKTINDGTTDSDGQDTTLIYNGYQITAGGGNGGYNDGHGGLCTIHEYFTSNSIIRNSDGGNGRTRSDNVADFSLNDGFDSDIIGNNFYWGGGGGLGFYKIDINYINEPYNSITEAGIGGGGAGGFYLDDKIKNFTSRGGEHTYFHHEFNSNNNIYTDSGNNNDIINGADGINGSGGGGGGSIYISGDSIEGNGGNGGNGIAIIKFKNMYDSSIVTKNGYLYYNYEINKWEVQSLNLLNLNVNRSIITSEITNTSNDLIKYIEQIAIPLNSSHLQPRIITAFNIASESINSEHIFGHYGLSSNFNEGNEIESGIAGLIKIPDAAYTNPNSEYYKRLIDGSKLADNSITNYHLVDNTITSEKIRGSISGSKLSNLSIDYNDIIGLINSKVFLTNYLNCNIYFSNFSNINLDLSYFNVSEDNIYDGYSIIITNNDDIKIPINIFSNISIDYSHLDTSSNYEGTLNLYSSTNNIDINIFSNININIDNLEGYDQENFIISNVNLLGIIPQNYIDKMFVNVDNLNSNSLVNTRVYLSSYSGQIDNGLIQNFNITYDQLNDANISNVTIKINQDLINNSNIYNSYIYIDNIDYDINNFSNVSIIFSEDSNINSSNIYNSYINIDNIDYDINDFSNVGIIFSEGSNINSINIYNSYINIDNIDYDINGFSNVDIIINDGNIINSSNILNCTINNANIDYRYNLLSNVNINFNFGEMINASNIDYVTINNSNIFYNDFNKLYNISIDFIEDGKINASNIFSSLINNSNIYYDDNNKLSNVIIEGIIDSDNIANAILNSGSTIIGNNQFSVTIDGTINSSNISTAILSAQSIIIGNNKIDNVFVHTSIQSSNISNAILSPSSTIIGNEKIPNVLIRGEINAGNIYNALIHLDDVETFLSDDSKIEGPVTITGIIYSSNFDFATYSNQINIDLVTGDNTVDGNILVNKSIDSTKLSSNLELYIDSITFNNGNIITNLNDYYTSNQINNNFVSKDYHKTELANKIISNSNININLYNHSDNTYSNYKAPFILNDNYIFIDSTSNIYTNEDYALLNIYDKNRSANIYIYSKNNSLYEFDNIDRTSTDNGSMIKFNNPLLSINLQNSNVMEFNINSNISYNDFKLNGNIIFSDNTTIGSGNFNSLYNSYTKQLIMDNTRDNINYNDSSGQSTGEGFIHCNGLHAMFDITAFSTTNSSDKRLKKDIKELSYDNEILKLNPVSFKWNDKNKSNSSNVGFIAQEIEELLPILVKDGPDNYKTVNYTGLIPYLVKHIQNLEERIKILENK